MANARLLTTVVGSSPVPEWLANAKTDFYQRKLSRTVLDEIQLAATKAAVKDQELAGIDVVTDGEMQRDNSLDHFLIRLPGVEVDNRSKAYYFDFFQTVVRADVTPVELGLVQEFRLLQELTGRQVKCTIPGAYSMFRRLVDEHYRDDRRLALDLAGAINTELRRLESSGCRCVQIDDEYLAGYPEDIGWGVELINRCLEGITMTRALHVCFGNRYGKPSWAGDYGFLVPAVFDTQIDVLVLEFARRGFDDLRFFSGRELPFDLGLGVIDVKDTQVETPEVVADRVIAASQVVPAERLSLNPDCGLRHLTTDVANAKMRALVQGRDLVLQRL
jgi:5-methyltetrahydropteroyltriglutamate--homocysteine methyltransferase